MNDKCFALRARGVCGALSGNCSGYVGWVFYNALDYRCTQGAASQYREWCTKIGWEQLQREKERQYAANREKLNALADQAGGAS